ncbi:MAG: DUF2252 family protein [Bacteriovorax sp.]|nr:DUF2252 family protein [Bacteriovorax sp.]
MRFITNFTILFSAVFFSSNLNFQNYNLQYSKRAPASEQSCQQIITAFYPNQTEKFLEKRIELNLDAHSFYRAFVPLFYKIFSDNSQDLKKLKELEKFISTIAGDAHFENFGLIIDDHERIHFNINDFDDSTEGFLYFDVFRNYISSDFLTNKMNWEDYRNAYLSGIRGENKEYSKVLQKKIDTALIQRDSILKTFLSKEAPFKFIKFKKPNREITQNESRILKDSLLKKFPQIEILDKYVRIKDDGGSAGMMQFNVLVRLKPETEIVWLNLKELETSSLDKVFNSTSAIKPASRIKTVRINMYGNEFNESIDTVIMFEKTFSLKSVDQFLLGILATDFSKDELNKLVLDEAFALGKMHSTSLAAKSLSTMSYSKAWEKIAVDDLKKISDKVKDQIKELYKKSKN